MSDANELLDSLTDEDISAYTAEQNEEGHIIIGLDRSITVPNSLKRIAVQFDHNMETVTFDCPRYWDGIDMSTMFVYINYKLPNGYCGAYIARNVTVDETDETLMHFDWTITNVVTQYKGNIAFLVCIRKADEGGNEENHWNTELNTEMYISEGLECEEADLYVNPDVISHLLQEMQDVDRKIKDAVSTLVVDGTSLAVGNGATVSGDGSLAVSHGNSAEAKNGGVAIGDYVKADGLGSLAIGYHSEAKGAFSVALGIGAIADTSNPNPEYGSIMAFCYKPQNGDPFWIDDKGIPHARASKGYSGDVYDEAMPTDSLVTKLSLQKAIQSLNNAIQSELQNTASEMENINTEVQNITSEIESVKSAVQNIRTEMPKTTLDVKLDGVSAVDIYPNVFTVLKDSNEREPGPIKLNLIEPTNNNIVNEYRIRITAALSFSIKDSKAFECIGGTVKGLPAEIVAGTTYEISIIDGFATYATWE